MLKKNVTIQFNCQLKNIAVFVLSHTVYLPSFSSKHVFTTRLPGIITEKYFGVSLENVNFKTLFPDNLLLRLDIDYCFLAIFYDPQMVFKIKVCEN